MSALAISLRGVAPDERAKQLSELFHAGGWFADQPGPPLDTGLWRVAGDTLRELAAGPQRDELLETLGQQLARARGTNAMSELLSLSTLTLNDEQRRVSGRPAEPEPDAAALAGVRAALADAVTSAQPSGNAILFGAFGIGGATANAEDQRALIQLATDGASPRTRCAGYFALATTPPSEEVDGFLLRRASSVHLEWQDRMLAWQSLRRRGREEQLPIAIRQEILTEWQRSGEVDQSRLLND